MIMARRVMAAAGMLLAIGMVAQAADWPQWQGPGRDNKSPDTGLLKSWPEGGPALLWKQSGLGAKGFSSVAIAGGLIHTSGSPDSKQSVVTALGMDGAVKWQTANGPEFLQSHGGTRATPTIVDGLLYVLSGMGRLGCFDAKGGEEKWAVDLVKTYGGKIPQWGYSESVAVAGDVVFVTVGGTGAGMAAFNRKTGELVWKSEPSLAASYCPPLVLDFGGVRQVITGTGVELVGVKADNGKILWRFPTTNQWKVHATTPVFQGGGLYLTSGYGAGGFRLDLAVTGDAVAVTPKWTDPSLDNHHGGVVMVEGFIYGYGDKAGWTCLDFQTGAARWSSKAFGKGSVTYADGMLYCFAEGDGALALVRATPEKFDLVSRFNVPSGGVKEFWAHPVVLDGRLYARHSDVLYCYDVKAK
jgi:outer membrane protein assembly factor BamB